MDLHSEFALYAIVVLSIKLQRQQESIRQTYLLLENIRAKLQRQRQWLVSHSQVQIDKPSAIQEHSGS